MEIELVERDYGDIDMYVDGGLVMWWSHHSSHISATWMFVGKELAEKTAFLGGKTFVVTNVSEAQARIILEAYKARLLQR